MDINWIFHCIETENVEKSTLNRVLITAGGSIIPINSPVSSGTRACNKSRVITRPESSHHLRTFALHISTAAAHVENHMKKITAKHFIIYCLQDIFMRIIPRLPLHPLPRPTRCPDGSNWVKTRRAILRWNHGVDAGAYMRLNRKIQQLVCTREHELWCNSWKLLFTCFLKI